MWKESVLKILSHHNVTSDKKFYRDGFKEKVLHDILIEANISNKTVTISSEDRFETVDLIFSKNKSNRPRKLSLDEKKMSSEKLAEKAESHAEKRGYVFPEEKFWIEKDHLIYEKYSKSTLLSRIYKCEENYDCYVFTKGGRLDDYFRFEESDLSMAKSRAEAIIKSVRIEWKTLKV